MSRISFSKRNFVCECGKIEQRYKWSNDEKPEICDCSKDMTEIFDQDIDSPFIGRFKSMTPQQRSKVLSKRSKEHFKKELKDKKFEVNRQLRRDVYGKD